MAAGGQANLNRATTATITAHAAIPKGAFQIGITRSKEAVYKVIVARDVGQFYRQT